MGKQKQNFINKLHVFGAFSEMYMSVIENII